MSIIIFFIILGVLIVAHEAGHFLVAKFFGIRVDEFAFGFPPRLFGIKKGETEYAINAVPFGGYVKIFGEDGSDGSLSEDDKKVSFVHKPRHIQAFVIVAGVLANFLLGWALITTGYLIGLPTPATGGPEGFAVTDTHLVITSVRPDSPASKGGVLPGDRIVSLAQGDRIINDQIKPSDVSDFISKTNGDSFTLGLERGWMASSTILLIG
ncbi:MAG: site-2 protease family protein, partial [Patescibacteria group bacterium]